MNFVHDLLDYFFSAIETGASLDVGQLVFSGNFSGVDEVEHVFLVLLLLLADRLILSDLIHRMITESVLGQLILYLPEISSSWQVDLTNHL